MRDIMMHVRDILSTMGDVQYFGGYHDKCGGYLEYRGGIQYCGGYHEHRGSYLEYRGGFHDACGGYHGYCGGVQYRGEKIFCYLSNYGTEHPPWSSLYPHMYHDIRHSTEYPAQYLR